jgi:response regulator of citrate/malate metabolism
MGNESVLGVFASPETAILLRTPVAITQRTCKPHKGITPCFRTLRFVDWMTSRRSPATAEDVITHFEVSRATAYRWLRAYADARGLVWPVERIDGRPSLSLPSRSGGVPAYLGGSH